MWTRTGWVRPSEIDDIDLENTMDSAVTVVEWGRGRVEHLSESRLEGGPAPQPAAAPRHGARQAAQRSRSSPADPGVLDFDTDDDDEPRTIVIRGFGPRWVDPPRSLRRAANGPLPHTLEGN